MMGKEKPVWRLAFFSRLEERKGIKLFVDAVGSLNVTSERFEVRDRPGGRGSHCRVHTRTCHPMLLHDRVCAMCQARLAPLEASVIPGNVRMKVSTALRLRA